MYIYYDPTTGAVLHSIAAPAPLATPPANPGIPLYLDDATWGDVWEHPQWYVIVNDTPMRQPHWTATVTSASGTTTITATLADPPSPAPTSATVTIGATALPLALTANSGTISVQVHESLIPYAIPVAITASGTVSTTATLGQGSPPPVGIQAVVPATSGAPYLIAPAGPGSLAHLRRWAFGLLGQSPDTALGVVIEALQNLMISVAATNHLLVTKILPALQSSTYTPLTLTSAETAALSTWSQNVVPYLVAFADLLDSAGQPIPPYSELQAQAPQSQQALQAYAQALATLPNLA